MSFAPDAGGSLLLFLPCLPLFLLGFVYGARQAAFASIIASIVAGVFSGPGGAVFFIGFTALPACYFIYKALLWRGDEHERQWHSMLAILSELTVVAATLLMLVAFLTQTEGGLKELIPAGFVDGFKDADPDVAAMARQLAGEWSFVLFASLGWLWVLMLYALAVLANMIMQIKERALRPSLALEAHGLSSWLLLLLALSGLMALMGQGLDRFTAEALFLLLLLPYLLCGIAYVHATSSRWHSPMRRLWITCFYIALVILRWPALAVIAIGLYVQLAEILDRHKRIG